MDEKPSFIRTTIGFFLLVALAYIAIALYEAWLPSDLPAINRDAGIAVAGALFGGILVDPFQNFLDRFSELVNEKITPKKEK